MIAAILSTGTELTRGEVVNTNATWLADELIRLGVEVTTIETVDDNVSRITEAFRKLSLDHDAVVCTGGLGPTTDDLTAESLSRACGVPLETHAPSLAQIEERLRVRGRPMTTSNAKQARLPLGCQVLPNANGTAPGFVLPLNRARIYCLPGVPFEMKAMFAQYVAPAVSEVQQRPIVQIVLHTFGLGESSVNDLLQDLEDQYGVVLGYRVHFPEVAVKVVARRDSMNSALKAAKSAAAEVRQRLGVRAVFGEGDETLPSVLNAALNSRAERVAVAESCTGGLVSALVTSVPGASDVFTGSVIAYANDIKREFLGVPSEVLDTHGAVSQAAALAMAAGVRRRFNSDWGLATTGIAGPGGATLEKPLGTVHFAVSGPGLLRHQHRVIPGDRAQVQRMAAYLALNWLRCLLNDPEADFV